MPTTIAWILLNLLISNVLLELLPGNVGTFFLGMWSPALTAMLFLLAERQPFTQGLAMHVGQRRVYAIAALVPVIVAGGTVGLGLVTGYLGFSEGWRFPVGGALGTFLVWIIASLGEELGWRGYLHRRLRHHKHAPLLIGLVWAAWHYRQVFGAAGPRYALFVFTPMVFLTSFVLSELVERGHSVWPCALYHGVWNFLRLKVLAGHPSRGAPEIFSSTAPQLTEMEGVFGLLVLAIISASFIRSWYRAHPQRLARAEPL
jgi:membrane protease YdiL (CAAX protease family)